MATENAAIVVAAEELVQQVMGAWDSSHDPFHALRVRDLALSLAAQEGLQPPSLLIVSNSSLNSSPSFWHHLQFPRPRSRSS